MGEQLLASNNSSDLGRRTAEALLLPDVNTPDLRLVKAKNTVVAGAHALEQAPPVKPADKPLQPGERLLYKSQQEALRSIAQASLEATINNDSQALQENGSRLNQLLTMGIPPDATFVKFEEKDGNLVVFYKLPRAPDDKSIAGVAALQYMSIPL